MVNLEALKLGLCPTCLSVLLLIVLLLSVRLLSPIPRICLRSCLLRLRRQLVPRRAWGGGGVEEMGEALIDYGDRCAAVSGCVDAARGGAYFVPAVRRASGRFRLGAANARCGLVD